MSQVESPPNPLSPAQSEVNSRHLASPISDEHHYTLPASRNRSPSAPSSPARGGEPESWKQREKKGRQDTHTEISSETHYSVNTDDTCDTDDEDPRPAKRRKPRSAPAVTVPLHFRSHPLVLPSTTNLEVGDAQPQADHGCSPAFIHNEHCHASRTSRSPSATAESVLAAEYQEWSLQSFLKRTKIGDETTYNLEFQLPHIPEHLHYTIPSEALSVGSNKQTSTEAGPLSNAVAQSKVRVAAVQRQATHLLWTPEEDATVIDMKKAGRSWEDIHAALLHRSKGTIQVRYSTKLKKQRQ
jgi:hypothetical protein